MHGPASVSGNRIPQWELARSETFYNNDLPACVLVVRVWI